MARLADDTQTGLCVMTTPTIESQSQLLGVPGALIELYTLDCTDIGGDVYYFTPHTAPVEGGQVVWQGNTYMPMPIVSSGWEYNGDGSQKKPSLSVSNVTRVLLQAVIELGDIVGAKVTRYRTFSNFLDGAANADPTQHFPIDRFVVEQKTSHDRDVITWQLCSIIDRMGIRLPRRQVTKDGDSRYCSFPAVGSYRPSRY